MRNLLLFSLVLIILVGCSVKDHDGGHPDDWEIKATEASTPIGGASLSTVAGKAGVKYKYGNGTEVCIKPGCIHAVIAWKDDTKTVPIYLVHYLIGGERKSSYFYESELAPWVEPKEPKASKAGEGKEVIPTSKDEGYNEDW